MKFSQILSLVVLLFCWNISKSQKFPVDTILQNGSIDNRINLVFLADGYKSTELAKFKADGNAVVTKLFSVPPFKEYKKYFNIYFINVPSVQSGATHPKSASDESGYSLPAATVNNYFGSTFDHNGIHRLLYPLNTGAIYNVLTSSFPKYDFIFMLVNTNEYGGAGGSYAVCSAESYSADIAIHELGHLFANLGDEYGSGTPYPGREAPNATALIGRTTIKWKNWVNSSTPLPTPVTQTTVIGAFEGAVYNDKGWYRPKANCRMRELGIPFCEVCKEALIEKIHGLTNPFDVYSPKQLSLNGTNNDTLDFNLSVLAPTPNTLKTEWYLNGTKIAKNVYSQKVILKNIPSSSQLIVRAIDTTLMSKDNNHNTAHLHSITWNINKTVTGIEVEGQRNKIMLTAFPNPFFDQINLIYEGEKVSELKVDLFNTQGQKIKSLLNEMQSGINTSFDLRDLNLSPGVYLVSIELNGEVFTQRIVKQ